MTRDVLPDIFKKICKVWNFAGTFHPAETLNLGGVTSEEIVIFAFCWPFKKLPRCCWRLISKRSLKFGC